MSELQTGTAILAHDGIHEIDPSTIVITGKNPREAEARPEIIASMRKSGFLSEHPLVCNRRGSGEVVLLQGECRLLSALFLRSTSPALASLLALVPVILYRGLTESQELELIQDHNGELDRKPLNRWEQYRAYRAFMRAGMHAGEVFDELSAKKWGGVHARCIRLGLRLGKGVNPYDPAYNLGQMFERIANCSSLIPEIEDHYRTLCVDVDGKAKTRLRTTDIAKLDTARNQSTNALHTLWDSIKASTDGPVKAKRPSVKDVENVLAKLPEASPIATGLRLASGLESLTDDAISTIVGDAEAHAKMVADATAYATILDRSLPWSPVEYRNTIKGTKSVAELIAKILAD